MTFLTDFADQAVVLPVVVVIAAILVVRGRWREALIWLGVIGATFGVVLVLKIIFLACGPVFRPWSMRSPSGHTASAAVLIGGLAALLTGRLAVVWPVSALAGGAIGFTRVALGFHSVPEVLLGGMAGMAGAVVLVRPVGVAPIRRPVSLLVIVAVVAVALHGVRLPAEAAIWRFAQGLLDFVPACRVVAKGGPV